MPIADQQKMKACRFGSMRKLRILIFSFAVVSILVTLIQIHLVENHVSIESPLSSPFSLIGERSKKNGGFLQNQQIDEDEDEDLKPVLRILRQGRYDISKTSTEIDRSLLPKWSEILEAYGPPRLLGLESCQNYRDSVEFKDRNIAPAGIFNSGTNVLGDLLATNCEFEGGSRIRNFPWQVPWGKHIPAVSRTNHTAKRGSPHYSTTLAVVSVRDPYTWMQSMCRQNYAAQFSHSKAMCPNIIPYPEDVRVHPRYKNMKYIPIHVKYSKDYRVRYESLPHLWNEWYGQYIDFGNSRNHNDASTLMKAPRFPFLVVRMEDLVFHANTIMPQICECAGGSFKNPDDVHLTKHVANDNSGIDTNSTDAGLLRSVIRYGNFTNRRIGYPKFQLEAAKDILDSRLMHLLGYPYEEPS